MRRMLKNKKVILSLTIIMTTLILSVSYATFVLSTGKVRASELLVAELSYGIRIQEDGSSGSSISGNIVSVPAGKKAYFYITVSSVNKIESKYILAYKTESNVVPQYTDRTAWGSQGDLNGYNDSIYSKTIRVVVDNTKGTNLATVSFAVYGGYTFNTFEKISLKNGYFAVPGGYKEILSGTVGRLVDIVEVETNCITNDAGTCYYGGGTEANYLQYPESENKSENLWRIIGTQKIGDKVLAKLVSESTGTTTVANINTSLEEFYKGLDNTDYVIEKTDKFNCSNAGCLTSSYNNIGLISIYEYNQIGGESSYLRATNPYYGIENTEVKNITSEGIENTESDTNSGLRPSIYLQTDVKVGGSGTVSDPYVIRSRSDINFIAYKLNNEGTTETYEWLKQYKIVDKIECEKGTIAEWDEETKSIKLSDVKVPDYCTIYFKDGYSVNLEAVNGTVEATPLSTIHNGSVTFTVEADSDYVLLGSSGISCPEGAKGTIEGNKVTISGVKKSQTCTITMDTTLIKKILADNPNVSTRTNFDEVFTSNTANTIYKINGDLTENGKDVYYFAGTEDSTKKINNWVKFGKDKDENNLYWRIIRTNEDRSVRLLYAGSSNSTESSVPNMKNAIIGTSSAFNSSATNTRFAGYMYGSEGDLNSNRGLDSNGNYTGTLTDSNIKNIVDTWYGQGLDTKTDGTYKYDSYISKTAIYCNDRSGDGYASSGDMYYGVYTRLESASVKQPSYRCGYNAGGGYTNTSGSFVTKAKGMYSDASNADRFSASTTSSNGVTGGNGYLKYPVALMTADEVSFAGGLYDVGNSKAWYYLNATSNGSIVGDKFWWTMSPDHTTNASASFGSGYSFVFYVGATNSPGKLKSFNASYEYKVRPVVSLKSCVEWKTGNGTVDSPYEVEINEVCAQREN